jgi:DNA-binding transcriptional regulator GbsR (MarR family)
VFRLTLIKAQGKKLFVEMFACLDHRGFGEQVGDVIGLLYLSPFVIAFRITK